MIGTRLAQYEITGHLGQGGMGEVYLAVDSKLGRSVAIKLLPEMFARDAERSARLEREARVLASLNHPGIAAIYDIEQGAGRSFIVMEFVPGEILAEIVKRVASAASIIPRSPQLFWLLRVPLAMDHSIAATPGGDFNIAEGWALRVVR